MGLNKNNAGPGSRSDMYPFVSHTWNLIKGRCKHGCTYCYMLGHPSWEVPAHIDEKEFKVCPVAKDGTDRFVFIGSSTDHFSGGIPAEWIERVLAHCKRHSGDCCRFGHVKYLFQTKNPARMLEFADQFPDDVMLGITIETNREEFGAGEVTKAPPIAERVEAAVELSARGFPILLSIEPVIRFDLIPFVQLVEQINPTMISIGADSRGEDDRRRAPIYEPSKQEVIRLIQRLDHYPLVLKKNLKRIMDKTY